MPELNQFAQFLVKAFQRERKFETGPGGIRVNPIVSELASWYEKLRNAMEYHEDETILRGAIERILKRRLIFGGTGKTVAAPLLRELVWARYFPNGSIPESMNEKVSHIIDLYLKLREEIILRHHVNESQLNTWIRHLMSSELAQIVRPQHDKEAMVNFMFHVLGPNIHILDDTEQTQNAQVFIAIRKAYAKNDLAFLRYHLFLQYFGELTKDTLPTIAQEFVRGRKEIERQLKYPLRFKILLYIKKQTPPFFILDDVLKTHEGNISSFIEDEKELRSIIFDTCQKHYNSISSKVRRAIVRSVIFLILSKALFAFLVEGTYERYIYGEILWSVMAINISVPPILMILAGLTIRAPNVKNSEKIFQRIQTLLFSQNPIIGHPLSLRHIPKKSKSVLETVFGLLWFAAFIVSFGIVVLILTQLHFNPVSQAVFIFFLTVVVFLVYRIKRTAREYNVDDGQGILTPLIDLLFLPIAQVGRHLTEGISQINVLLFVLDFLIEAPFKAIFEFFEQLFGFLHAKREYLE